MKLNKEKVSLLICWILVLAWGIFLMISISRLISSFIISETDKDSAARPTIEVTYYDEPYKITVYTPYSDNGKWGYLTATGVKSKHLTTCAVDPKVIPLGSVIEVNGLKLKAVDTGSAVKGNIIDIFYDGSNEDTVKWLSGFGTSHSVEFMK